MCRQWAKIVVTLERAVNSDDAHKYLQEYSIRLGPGDDGTAATEQRGVMVIKSKSKTRAKQRKGAVMNWKRVGKVTIKELHKRNMTGEQLRRLMWERASISTPVRVSSPDLLDGDTNVGFGGLAAALDVMAFTNDISLPTSTTGPTLPSAPAGAVAPNAPAVGTAPSAPVAPMANGGVPTMGWQKPGDAGTPAAAPIANGAPAQMGWQKPGDTGQASTLFSSLTSSLAPDPPPAYPSPPPHYDALDPDAFRQLVLAADALEPGALTELARRAALVDELAQISPRKQHEYCCRGMVESRQKQLSVDHSESDTLGDGPVLGKGSRLRRARSARQRNVASAPSAPLDQYARYHHDHNNNQRSSSSEAEDTIAVTVATVKTHLLPNGNAPANGHAGKKLDGATTNREITSKPPGKPRPKTARNRVAPQESGQPRRVTSAAPTPASVPAAPDPLDAWSTKDIANINSLLDDGDDSM